MRKQPKTLTQSQLERLETRLMRKELDRTRQGQRKRRRGEKLEVLQAMFTIAR